MIFLVGPTAAGKSEVAVELALRIGGEIISADSMQVYRGMDLGTAKLSAREQKGVTHHLLDVIPVTEGWDVAKFRGLALSAIQEIRGRKARVIVAGGSGLYVRSLTRGLFEGAARDDALRAQFEALDTPVLRQRLQRADPVSASRIDAGDRRRMIRALECFTSTGRPISELQTQWHQNLKSQISNLKFQLIGLNRPRPEIYERCNRRVDLMFERGLIEEVAGLLKRGLKADSPAARAIGYSEVICYLLGGISLKDMIAKTKQRTRQFAKRQWTWFRREPGIQWVDVAKDETIPQIAVRLQTFVNS